MLACGKDKVKAVCPLRKDNLKQIICKTLSRLFTKINRLYAKINRLFTRHDSTSLKTTCSKVTHDTLKLTHDTNTGWWHEGTLYRAAPCLNRTGNEAGQFPKFLRSSSSNIHAPFLLISSDHGHKTDILLQIRAICLLLRKSGIFSKSRF